MKITKTADVVVIDMSPRLPTRVKALFSIQGTFNMLLGTFFLITAIEAGGSKPILGALILLIALATFYMGIRLISRFSDKEEMTITKDKMQLCSKKGFKSSVKVFENNKVLDLKYTGAQAMTKHPLKGDSIDYLGFEARQSVVAVVNPDDNLSFNYEGVHITFGKGIYSWDIESINNAIVDITNGYLFIANIPTSIQEIDYLYPSN